VICFFLLLPQCKSSEWLKESLKQCDFELPRPKTKHLIVLLPNIEVLFFVASTNFKTRALYSKYPHSHEKPFEHLGSLFFPLTNVFVIQHILKTLPM
jgi:hypothetical protein